MIVCEIITLQFSLGNQSFCGGVIVKIRHTLLLFVLGWQKERRDILVKKGE